MAAQCVFWTPQQFSDAIASGWTVVGGPYDDEDACGAICGCELTITPSTDCLETGASSITIYGTGFDDMTPGNNVVTFNLGAAGTCVAATSTELTVTITTPPSVGTLTAIVTVDPCVSAEVQVAETETSCGITTACCPDDPIPETLNMNISTKGDIPLTWNGSTGWTSGVVAVSGCGTISVTLTCTGSGATDFVLGNDAGGQDCDLGVNALSVAVTCDPFEYSADATFGGVGCSCSDTVTVTITVP